MPGSIAGGRAHRSSFCVVIGLVAIARLAAAQNPDTVPAPSALKKLSLEQLMNVEVTSVSRRPEQLSRTASAIQVITGEDIRRSGASSLAEALRLAPNLQVAQVNASQWAISARGFDNTLANKLLVLIDGRTVYTPLYAGVFWDAQNPPLEAVDRIEVISGPGGTLWGANAVNGVINVITKSAKETPGVSVAGGGGTELQGFGGLRYGAAPAPGLAFRVYGEGFDRGSTRLANGTDAYDSWNGEQGGFRADWDPGRAEHITLQGDYGDIRPNVDGHTPVVARSGNLLGRWTRALSAVSDVQLQVYYDRAYRDFGQGFTEDLSTYDADWQHRIQIGQRQELIWGVGARLIDDQTDSTAQLVFVPPQRWLHLYSAFVQDEIVIVPDRLRLVVGSKLEHNDYTGYEVQPSARFAWTPTERQTIWAALSRAVRAPSRIDRDFFAFAAPGVPIIVGSNFQSEELLATELGWRFQPRARLSGSLATFYNFHDHLRSVEPGPPPTGYPITLQNGVAGHSYGVEISAVFQVTDRWRLRGGYTFLKKDLTVQPGSNDLQQGRSESEDPEHQFLLQSSADLPGRIEWDAVMRYVDALPNPYVPSYVGLDLRVAWKPIHRLEIAIVGQHLLDDARQEFRTSSAAPHEIQRGVYAKVTWR